MKAECPTCSCVVWVADDEVVDQTIDITCPACGICFSVRDCKDQGSAGHGDVVSSFFGNDAETVEQLRELPDSARQSDQSLQPHEEYTDSVLYDDPSVVEAEKSLAASVISQPNDSAQVNVSKTTTGVSAIRAQSGFKKDVTAQDSNLEKGSSTDKAMDEYGPDGLAQSASLRAWKMLATFSSLAVLTLLCVTLARYGVVDLPFGLFKQSADDVDSDEIEAWPNTDSQVFQSEDPEDVFRQSIAAGRQALLAKRFSRAALEFNRALSVHPSSIEALQGLAKAYYGLGDLERAALVEVQYADKK